VERGKSHNTIVLLAARLEQLHSYKLVKSTST